MKPFFVYVIRCNDKSFYVGHTDDIELRWAQHQHSDFGGYTSMRHPLELVFVEEIPSRDEALARERQIKNWSRAKKSALVLRDWPRLQALSRSVRPGSHGDPSNRP